MADIPYTVDQYVGQLNLDDITDYHSSILWKGDGIEMVELNVIFDYIDELKKLAQKTNLDNMNYFRYRWHPDLLSLDLYGTTDFEFVLLAINDISHPWDFDFHSCLIIPPNFIVDLLSYITDAEDEYIIFNRNQEGINLY